MQNKRELNDSSEGRCTKMSAGYGIKLRRQKSNFSKHICSVCVCVREQKQLTAMANGYCESSREYSYTFHWFILNIRIEQIRKALVFVFANSFCLLFAHPKMLHDPNVFYFISYGIVVGVTSVDNVISYQWYQAIWIHNGLFSIIYLLHRVHNKY